MQDALREVVAGSIAGSAGIVAGQPFDTCVGMHRSVNVIGLG